MLMRMKLLVIGVTVAASAFAVACASSPPDRDVEVPRRRPKRRVKGDKAEIAPVARCRGGGCRPGCLPQRSMSLTSAP